MGGRIYDAGIGRFLQADPFVQDRTNLQALNRYSYVQNNPLSYTDPSGYFLKSLFKKVGGLGKKAFHTIRRSTQNTFKAIGRAFDEHCSLVQRTARLKAGSTEIEIATYGQGHNPLIFAEINEWKGSEIFKDIDEWVRHKLATEGECTDDP